MRKDADAHRINYVLTAGFLGRLCLSGDVEELTPDQWAQVKEAIRFYCEVNHIIRDGFTDVIETNVKDYARAEGYQAVRRVLGDEMMLVIHTFENGANPPVNRLMDGWSEITRFGSALDGDFRGAVIHCRR